MGAERHAELMEKYCVPNMGELSVPGSPLSEILDRLDKARKLSGEDKQYLRDKGLFDLSTFVETLETTGQADFRTLRAPLERRQGRAEERALKATYQIDYFEWSDKRRLFGILRAVDGGARLSDDDVLWLKRRDYFSAALRRVFHQHEAAYYRNRFEKNADPWDAVNGSSHFRKADLAQEAISLVEKVPAGGNEHLQSAVCTTRGGALRDLRKFEEAILSAEAGHRLEPTSFHPCTLLGALYYELNRHADGDAWFSKAMERGASRDSVDQELKSIFMRATGAQREAMKRHLLELNPELYEWVNGMSKKGSKPVRGRRR